jgi:hypothetical protein
MAVSGVSVRVTWGIYGICCNMDEFLFMIFWSVCLLIPLVLKEFRQFGWLQAASASSAERTIAKSPEMIALYNCNVSAKKNNF